MTAYSCLLLLAVAMVISAVPVSKDSVAPTIDKLVYYPEEGVEVVPGEYLVTVHPETDLEAHVGKVAELLEATDNGSGIEKTWHLGKFKGYLLLNNGHNIEVLQSIAAMKEVRRIEPNLIISGDLCSMHQTPNWVSGTPLTWGLVRLNFERTPNYSLDQVYHYNSSALGAGVNIYVLDSGIRMDLGEFDDATIEFGWDFIDDPPSHTDENGHGTAVAGVLVSKCCGIARRATLINVRVLNEDLHGTTAIAISALNWVMAQQAEKDTRPSIINLSFSVGTSSEALDAALSEVHAAGISVVAASGNKKADSCTVSPARAPTVIAVAATDKTDAFWFPSAGKGSNYGKCVDILAPGVDILTTDKEGGYQMYTGTSISAPFVSGAMAVHISGQHSADPDYLKEWLHTSASMSASISNLQPDTTNKLLHMDCV